ncbi:MAG: hypothetical protein HOP96_12535 [Sphingomonas sp.]|nr:hypothetical protein [Sphingomonas sp.]
MSSTESAVPGCRVVGAEELPAESGGADALCKAIASAAAEKAPGVSYSIEVRVLPRSQLAAAITTGDGRKLAEQNFASMDRPLSSGSFKRFADAIAIELAKAGKS